MRDLMTKMNKHRVEDKVAFKNNKDHTDIKKTYTTNMQREQSPQKVSTNNNGVGGNSGPRPVSEPGGVNKKSINYRIKNKVIKR